MPRSLDKLALIKKEFLKYVLATVLGIVGFLLTRLLSEIQALNILQISPDLSSNIINTLILLLLLLLLISSFAAILFYRKTHVKPPSGGYEFLPDPGYYIHKNGGHYCNPCLSKGMASRLSIHHKDGLKCRTCGEIYINPESEFSAFKEYTKQEKEKETNT